MKEASIPGSAGPESGKVTALEPGTIPAIHPENVPGPGSRAIMRSRYFNLKENWGNSDKVHPVLIEMTDEFRGKLGCLLHISPVKGAVYAENTGHAEDSWHYIIPGRNSLAMAMDVFPETDDVISAWLLAVKMGFGGIGYYPFAEWRDRGLSGMLHIDVRHLIQPGPQALWWRGGGGAYLGINTLNELAYMIDTARMAGGKK